MVNNKIITKSHFYIYILLLSILILLSGCFSPVIKNNLDNISFDRNKTNSSNISYYNTNLTSSSNLREFYGKPSIILFGATFCSHCLKAVPVFKEKVYDIYGEKVNIWINVIDKGVFDVEDIPQGYNPNLIFNNITKTECEYVPSWVILDRDGNVELSSCGGEREMSEMLIKINELI